MRAWWLNMKESGSYFPGLDGLRFLAAGVVLLTHLEQAYYFYVQPTPTIGWFLRSGPLAVSFFFTLSGFLITSLLIAEQNRTGHVQIKKFYWRRVLRIWPLYYFIAFLGLVLLPQISAYRVPTFGETFDADYGKKLLLFGLISPHLALHLMLLPYASLLWSLGVEEWFYLFWPWVARFGPRAIFAGAVALISVFAANHATGLTAQIYFLPYLRFDCMAIGALAALTVKTQSSILAGIRALAFHPLTQILLYVCTLALFFGPLVLGLFEHMAFSVLFALIILNVGTNARTLLRLEAPWLKWLGQRSFGIYCYNWIGAVTAVLIAKFFDARFQGVPVRAMTLLFGSALTIGMATVSYAYLERPFLRLKNRRFQSS